MDILWFHLRVSSELQQGKCRDAEMKIVVHEREKKRIIRWSKTCLSIFTLSWIGLGKPISVVKSSLIEKPTNFFRVCSKNVSRSFCRTLGVHGNSLIIRTVAGSMLDASLANEVVDSDGVEIKVFASSSLGDELIVLELSSLFPSASRAVCFVKL